ncbi:MAG: acetate kinase, partial [Bacteroidales bacterium]|nr:acetate kinase [Bacteroidales bacterium]
MIILVLNCGSSSLKYQVLDMQSDDVWSFIDKASVERIGQGIGVVT